MMKAAVWMGYFLMKSAEQVVPISNLGVPLTDNTLYHPPVLGVSNMHHRKEEFDLQLQIVTSVVCSHTQAQHEYLIHTHALTASICCLCTAMCVLLWGVIQVTLIKLPLLSRCVQSLQAEGMRYVQMQWHGTTVLLSQLELHCMNAVLLRYKQVTSCV